eukprot:jgi/Ulvmu1/5431/UM022_0226.1
MARHGGELLRQPNPNWAQPSFGHSSSKETTQNLFHPDDLIESRWLVLAIRLGNHVAAALILYSRSVVLQRPARNDRIVCLPLIWLGTTLDMFRPGHACNHQPGL